MAIVDGRGICPTTQRPLWLEQSGITDGPLFQTMSRGRYQRGKALHRSDIPRIVKNYAALTGLTPKQVAGHSLRKGFVSSAAFHHARLDKFMEVTRHKSPATVMEYIRDGNAFAEHAGRHCL